MTEMKIKAIAPWFGGKRTLASKIVELIGKHGQYFEPFCGSMAVLFAKPRSQKETVNDLHGDLINLAFVLQDEPKAIRLYQRCERSLFSQGLLEEARAQLTSIEPETMGDEDRAYWYFLASWMGRNGTAGTARRDYQMAVCWSRGGGSPTVRWQNVVGSMPAWHKRLRNVVILNRNAFDILDRFEDVPQTAIYVDSPYAPETRGNGTEDNRSGKYLYEFQHDDSLLDRSDHSKLAEQLNQYKSARIIVSYYDCPRIRRLYDGWHFHKFTMTKELSRMAANKQTKEAPEVLITNFDPGGDDLNAG